MNKIFRNKYFVVSIAVLAIILVTFIIFFIGSNQKKPNQKETTTVTEPQTTTTTIVPQKSISQPLDNAKARVTKKPFGIYITPQNSPVQPEKFSGYHTGTDFETTPQEANADVSVSAVCSGKIRVKQTVSGYGGVIIQDCTIENQVVTVLYGHLNIGASSVPAVSAEIKSGDKIGFLAPANSVMSGGERKHLHLGIHKGSQIDYHGYVQNKSELSGWLDVQKHL